MEPRLGSELLTTGAWRGRGVVLLFHFLLAAILLPSALAAKPNVLFLAVDDLKPVLGCYGDPLAKTPNLDRLAQRGMVFDLAYCNQAVCAPSRNNLLVGSRSTTLGIYSLGTNFRKAAPEAVTLPQYFMTNGYRAEGIGKIFHVGHGNHGDDASWSVPFQPDRVVEYLLPESHANGQLTREEALFANQRLGKIGAQAPGAGWAQSPTRSSRE